MEAVISLHPGRSPAALQHLAQQQGAQAVPMYPGAHDADGARWWLLQCPDAAKLPALVAQLQGQADVEAAYIKPDGEAPD